MKIKIKDNAAALYNTAFKGQAIPCHKWVEILRAVAGEWLEVETKFLFGDQFNTAPMPKEQVERCLARLGEYARMTYGEEIKKSLESMGVRVMIQSVASIDGDVRPGMARCGYCGKNTKAGEPCEHCQHGTEYVKDFEKFLTFQRTLYVERVST